MHVQDLVKKANENGGFYQFQLRDILFVVGLLFTGGSFLLGNATGKVQRDDKIDGQLATLTTNVATLNETVKGTNQRVNDIDIKGTQAGQSSDRMQSQKNIETDRRIGIIEASMTQGLGDIREIKTQVTLMVNYFNERNKK